MWKPALPAAALLVLVLLAGCGAQEPGAPDDTTTSGMTHQPGMSHNPTMSHDPGMSHGSSDMPTTLEGGQAAFAAIQEVVAVLEADPSTDWSRVNLSALRDHLVDMDEVTLRATVAQTPIDGGLEADVRGDGRTRDAILRMVPAHASFLDGHNGWSVNVETHAEGAILRVTAAPDEVDHVRGLGFFGLLVTQSHHQEHHLMIATGQAPH